MLIFVDGRNRPVGMSGSFLMKDTRRGLETAEATLRTLEEKFGAAFIHSCLIRFTSGIKAGNLSGGQ